MSLANITLTTLNVLNISSGTYNFTNSNVAGAQPWRQSPHPAAPCGFQSLLSHGLQHRHVDSVLCPTSGNAVSGSNFVVAADSASINIATSTFRDNTGASYGGALSLNGGSLNIGGST